MRNKLGIFALLGIVLGGASVMRADTFNTVPSWDHSTSIAPFGTNGATSTYGEEFSSATPLTMNDFTFYLIADPGTHLTYTGGVSAWDANAGRATGSALFFNSGYSIVGTGSFQAVTTNTGGLSLSAGQDYVAFLTVTPADAAASDLDSWSWGFVNGSNANTGFVYFNNNSDVSALNTQEWDGIGTGGDAAWSINGTNVATTPEPGSLTLLGTGIVGAFGMVRRKFRA